MISSVSWLPERSKQICQTYASPPELAVPCKHITLQKMCCKVIFDNPAAHFSFIQCFLFCHECSVTNTLSRILCYDYSLITVSTAASDVTVFPSAAVITQRYFCPFLHDPAGTLMVAVSFPSMLEVLHLSEFALQYSH